MSGFSADEAGDKPNVVQRLGDHFQSKIGRGLIKTLPVLITTIALVYVINFVDGLITPVIALAVNAGSALPYLDWLSALNFTGIGLIVSVVLFYALGLFVSMRYGDKITTAFVDVFKRVPVIKGVFGVTEQMTSVLTSEYGFSRVVFVEWPKDGVLSMGFVTARVQATRGGHSLVVVYIPSIPNPTSGNIALLLEDDVMETDMSVENAVKMILSGGIILPDSLALANLPGGERKDSDFRGRFTTERQDPPPPTR